jgi:hypothetical protein
MGADRIKKRSSAKVSDKIIFYSSRAIFSSVLNNNLNKYMKSQVQALPWRKSSFASSISSSGDKEKPSEQPEAEGKSYCCADGARAARAAWSGALSYSLYIPCIAARPEQKQLHTNAALSLSYIYLLS